jgi:chondroitin AC lyase
MTKCLDILFFLFFFSPWYISAYRSDDDMSIVHQRVLDYMVLPTGQNLTALAEKALNFTERLNSSCYWPDVDYYDKRFAHWRTVSHLYRITTMLQALTINGSSVQNDPRIRTAIHCAINVWLVNDWQAPNWYDNEIDVPVALTGHLLMLGDNVTSFEVEKIVNISYRAAWWLHRITDVGANLIQMIQAELYRSLATNNSTGVEEGFARIWQDIAVEPEKKVGIQHDWAYHFHGPQILSGAYGLTWAQTIFSFFNCSLQTKYVMNDQQLSTLAQFITKGDAWMIIGKNWDWHVIGRSVSTTDKEYSFMFSSKYMRIVAELILSNETKIDLINLADRLDGQSNASALTGNKHFFVSDYQVHRRANWISTIKMQSVRTQPIECILDQDLKAEHSGQGVLNLYTGNAYDYDDIFPLFDWQALNGITVEHDIPLEACTNGAFPWIKLSFVGGVSDNQYGLAMMDTASHNLTAQRSWHFYDDAIIALATNLTLKTSTTAWTTLASRLLPTGQITIGFFNSTVITVSDGNYSFPYDQDKTSNVQWIHIGESDIAYLLQNQQQYTSMGIELGTKTGNYDTIGPFNSTVTARMLTIWINHGIGPYTLDYNYMILPNISRESVPVLIKQYNEEQVFSCISTNNHFHGSIWPSLKRASFVLWDNISTTFSCKSPSYELNIELNDVGAYLFSETATDFTIAASHPTRIAASLQVNVDRVGSGKGCSTVWNNNANTTTVTLSLPYSSGNAGVSIIVTCKK